MFKTKLLFLVFVSLNNENWCGDASPLVWDVPKNLAPWRDILNRLYIDAPADAFQKRTREQLPKELVSNELLDQNSKRGRELFGKRSAEQLLGSADMEQVRKHPDSEKIAFLPLFANNCGHLDDGYEKAFGTGERTAWHIKQPFSYFSWIRSLCDSN